MAISLGKAEKAMLYAPAQDCLVTVSAPGTGKDAIWWRAVKLANAHGISVYSATMEAVDARGLPYVVPMGDDSKQVKWAAPNFLPLMNDKAKYEGREVWVNFTDWFQSPPPVLRATVRSIYGDGSNRRVGDFPILDSVRFFANGNRETDRAGVYRPESYVNDRITYIEVEPSVDEYISGAIGGFASPEVDEAYPEMRARINKEVALGIPDSLLGFVKWSKQIYDFSPEQRSFLSPRSIERLGRFMRAFEVAGINGDTLMEVANGTIGDQHACKFMAFLKLCHELPDTDAILRGEDVPLPPKLEILFVLATTIVRAAKKDQLNAVAKLITRMHKVTQNGMPVGVEASAYLANECIRGATKELRGLIGCAEIRKWLPEVAKYFVE